MHLLLTDRLCCPRCGPDFGLILLADQVQDQRVLEGSLGCSNCRDTYPVRSGLADLRPQPSPQLPPPGDQPGRADDPRPEDQEEAIRLGALLGITEGPGTLLLQGPASRCARSVANLLSSVEVVAVDQVQAYQEETPGVSRLLAGSRIPFFTGSLQGVLFSGDAHEGAPGEGTREGVPPLPGTLEEGARVLARGGRLVTLSATPDTASAVVSLGLRVLLEEEGVLVALKENQEQGNLVTLRGI